MNKFTQQRTNSSENPFFLYHTVILCKQSNKAKKTTHKHTNNENKFTYLFAVTFTPLLHTTYFAVNKKNPKIKKWKLLQNVKKNDSVPW